MTGQLTFESAPLGTFTEGISSLHIWICKSDQSCAWSKLTASLWGHLHVQVTPPGAGWLGRETGHRAIPGPSTRALPAGPGAAQSPWLDTTVQVWSPRPSRTLLLRPLARLCDPDGARAARSLTRTPSRRAPGPALS